MDWVPRLAPSPGVACEAANPYQTLLLVPLQRKKPRRLWLAAPVGRDERVAAPTDKLTRC